MSNTNKSILNKHTLFTDKKHVKSKEDLLNTKIATYGEKLIVDIPIKLIEVKPQVRKTFDQAKIKLLAEDIKSKGLIHPITVMKHNKNKNNYILIIGGNRIEAFRLLNRKTVPCIVKEYSNNEGDLQLLQLAENMHRNDLNPVELADALFNIKKLTGLTLDQIANAIGRSLDSIKQYSRISKLTKTEKEFHIKNKSTKNEILLYLAKTKKNKKNKSYLEFVKTPKKQKKLTDSNEKELLKKQIKEAEKFILEAKNKLIQLN